jgi:hypothetical protein
LIFSYICCFSYGTDTSIMDSEELSMHWQLQRKLTDNIFLRQQQLCVVIRTSSVMDLVRSTVRTD